MPLLILLANPGIFTVVIFMEVIIMHEVFIIKLILTV